MNNLPTVPARSGCQPSAAPRQPGGPGSYGVTARACAWPWGRPPGLRRARPGPAPPRLARPPAGPPARRPGHLIPAPSALATARLHRAARQHSPPSRPRRPRALAGSCSHGSPRRTRLSAEAARAGRAAVARGRRLGAHHTAHQRRAQPAGADERGL